MKSKQNTVLAAMLFVIFGVVLISPRVSAQESKSQTLTGTVTDTICGIAHNMKGMTPAECVRACAKGGGYALVVGKDVYALKGHEAELNKLAAETVTVKGTVTGKTMTVESVAPTKKG